MWSKFLFNNYPDYKNIIIGKEYVFQLLCNKTIIDAISTILNDKVKIDKDDKNVEDKATTNGVIIDDVIIDEAMIDKVIINKTMV